MAVVKRRSVVEFEKWLKAEIDSASAEMDGMRRKTESVQRQMGNQQVRIQTLEAVLAKLASPADDEGDAGADTAAAEVVQ